MRLELEVGGSSSSRAWPLALHGEEVENLPAACRSSGTHYSRSLQASAALSVPLGLAAEECRRPRDDEDFAKPAGAARREHLGQLKLAGLPLALLKFVNPFCRRLAGLSDCSRVSTA